MDGGLLKGEDDPVIVVNSGGASDFVLVCEHAGRVIPKRLGTLGLAEEDLARHIAWDIGAEGVARRMSAALDAPLILQRFSRLVYDCNRPPESRDAMPAVSETTPIPGNEKLASSEKLERIEVLYRPFHGAVSRLLDQRAAGGTESILITIHSFNPVYRGMRRMLDLGILHDTDSRLADALLKSLTAEPDLAVRRNEPYGAQDGVTHTLLLHGISRRLRNAMVEIRNDLVHDEAGQEAWAERLSRRLGEARMG